MIGTKEDWFNLNSLRSFPLEYGDTPVSDTGFVLVPSIIVDCMVVAQSNDFQPVLSSIHFSKTLITASFYDSFSGQDSFIAQVPISSDYSVANIISVGNFDVSGWVAFGEVSTLSHWSGSGLHKLSKTSNYLSSHCFMAAGPEVVSSVSGGGGKFTRNVLISASGELLTSVSSEVVNGVIEYSIVFYLSSTGDISTLCTPASNLCDCLLPPIAKINTVSPDSSGNINIVVDPSFGLQITNVSDGILLSLPQTAQTACNKTQTLPFPDGRLPSESYLTS